MFNSEDQTLEVYVKVRFYITDFEKASKLTKDGALLEDEQGNVFSPMLCLERIEGKGTDLYTDSDMTEALGIEIEEYVETSVYLKEE